MGKKDSKGLDYFEDLISKEITDNGLFEGQSKSSKSIKADVKTLDEITFRSNKAPTLAPPPPLGKNGPQAPQTNEKKQNKEQDFQEHSEASEIFASEDFREKDGLDVIELKSAMGQNHNLPMAEPFDVVPISSHEKYKPLNKNISELQDQLRSSNYLEVAQNRVLELEKEIQKLRRDGEQLAAAGLHFKELSETLKFQVKQAESNYLNLLDIAKEEKRILMQSLEAKEIKISVLQDRVVDIEQKQGSNHDNIRLRERELENRLEIMKSENEALTHSKDEMILELKKQLSSVNSDIEKYRLQNQKMIAKFESKEELLRRTVKALRMALTMLEGSQIDEG